MKYKQNSLFGGHFGRHLEFKYEESTSRLGTRARKFAHCIIFNIKLSNLFSGGGGTKFFFALLASALKEPDQLISPFAFATKIVQSFYFLNLKF